MLSQRYPHDPFKYEIDRFFLIIYLKTESVTHIFAIIAQSYDQYDFLTVVAAVTDFYSII